MIPPRPPIAPPAPAAAAEAVGTPENPKKKRRTLRDAELELEESRRALEDVKRKLILTARENAKMKVLLMKYIDRDDSLLSSSQLSVGESSSQRSVSADATPSASTSSFRDVSRPESALSMGVTTEEEDSEASTMWADDAACDDDVCAGPFEPVSQLSQISQASHWSELSSTSNLDEIINFLDSHDKSENDRLSTLQADYKRLREQKTVVRVGVGVLLMSKQHPECVLIGRRKGSHGEGKMALPGGHLELYESWEDCAVREAKEETDLDISKPTFAHVTNDPMEDEGKHYITILMQAEVDDKQTPKNMEPLKCEGWRWVPWRELVTRTDMFTPLLHLTRSSFQPRFE